MQLQWRANHTYLPCKGTGQSDTSGASERQHQKSGGELLVVFAHKARYSAAHHYSTPSTCSVLLVLTCTVRRRKPGAHEAHYQQPTASTP
eukprot:1684033-Amphidinium_carterae.1